MVFSCLKCSARFRVADDRLAGKVLRFTCPKCGQVHLLRDPATHKTPVEAVTSSAPAAGGSSASASSPTRHPTISEVRLTQSAPTVVPKTATPTGATHLTTRTGAVPAVPTAHPATAEVWYAIRRGQRVGPFTLDELLEALSSGTLHERSFLWRPTMASWNRLNQIPELAEVLEAHRRSRTRPSEDSGSAETVSPPPLPAGTTGPVVAARPEDSEVPPPLPPSREPPRATPAPRRVETTPAAGSEPVDALFSKISRPAIDLRKIREVQPEEPEIPDSLPLARDTPRTRPMKKVEPPEPRDDRSPTAGLAVSHEEKRFFSRAFVLPSDAWPTAPPGEAVPIEGVEPPAEPEVRAGRSRGRARETAPSLKDFSVMVRLTRKGKRRNLVLFGSLGILVAGVIGLVLYWSFSAGPAEIGIAPREDGEVPTFRQTLYAVPKPSRPAEGVPFPDRPEDRRRPTQRANGNGMAVPRVQVPEEPRLARAPEVDPTLNAEFQKYAGILRDGNSGRTETIVDVKPRTLTEMPQHRLDKDGMDAFLAGKMRKFSDCKARMKRKTDLPVKVVLGFSVGLDGKVHDVEVEQAAGPRDDGLDECIRRIVNGWAFPPPEEEATIRTTLLL